MQKTRIMIMTILLLGIISISGCIDTQKTNSTWGEKKLLTDLIKVSNGTVGNRSEENESIYHVYGYIENDNPFEALDPKIKVYTYFSNGTEYAVNDTPYLEPKNIPATGKSYFYARFEDPNKQIATFEVKIISAKGQY